MNVLVTGATGFIGRHAVGELVARGHSVRALVRPDSDASMLTPEVDVVRGELSEAARALDGTDGLIHLAGIGAAVLRRDDPTGGALRAVNVEGTRMVFEAARKAGVRRAVLTTTMWTVLRPDLAKSSPYVASRIDAEKAAFAEASSQSGVCVVCPTFVVGSGDRAPNFPGALVLAVLRRRLPLALPGGMTWIAVEDAASQIATALEQGEAFARYVIGAEHLSHVEVVAEVARLAGLRPRRWMLPRGLLSGAARAGDAALALGGRRAAIPLRAGVDLVCLAEPIDCTQTWGALGRPRIPVHKALADAVCWFESHGYVEPRRRRRA